jgi:hypothetical protein
MKICNMFRYKLFFSLLCLSQSLFAEQAADIFLKASVTPESNYVQAQFIYSLRLYYRVPIDSGQFSKLEIENAHVEQLGKDLMFGTEYQGLIYKVRERRYAIFPEVVGSFTIPAMEFNGMLTTPASECDPLFEYCIGEEVNFNSEPLEFDVKAKAYDDKIWWLPAQDVSLEEEWVLKQPFFQVGELVVRRLKLKSKALISEFLPSLSVPNVVDISSYSEPPRRKNNLDKDGVIGTQVQEVVLVANKAGYYELPAIELVWWDTINKEQRVVSLPAHKIYVRSVNEGLWWLWFWQILSGVLSLLFLISFIAWWRKKADKKKSVTENQTFEINDNISAARKALKQACKDNNPHEAEKALLKLNVSKLVKDEKLQKELELLNRVLYGKENAEWNGDQFWKVVGKSFSVSDHKLNKKMEVLPELYSS